MPTTATPEAPAVDPWATDRPAEEIVAVWNQRRPNWRNEVLHLHGDHLNVAETLADEGWTLYFAEDGRSCRAEPPGYVAPVVQPIRTSRFD